MAFTRMIIASRNPMRTGVIPATHSPTSAPARRAGIQVARLMRPLLMCGAKFVCSFKVYARIFISSSALSLRTPREKQLRFAHLSESPRILYHERRPQRGQETLAPHWRVSQALGSQALGYGRESGVDWESLCHHEPLYTPRERPRRDHLRRTDSVPQL